MVLHAAEASAEDTADGVGQAEEEEEGCKDHQGDEKDGEPEGLAASVFAHSPHVVSVRIPHSLDGCHDHQNLPAPRISPKPPGILVDIKPPSAAHAELLVQFIPLVEPRVGQWLGRCVLVLPAFGLWRRNAASDSCLGLKSLSSLQFPSLFISLTFFLKIRLSL